MAWRCVHERTGYLKGIQHVLRWMPAGFAALGSLAIITKAHIVLTSTICAAFMGSAVLQVMANRKQERHFKDDIDRMKRETAQYRASYERGRALAPLEVIIAVRDAPHSPPELRQEMQAEIERRKGGGAVN